MELFSLREEVLHSLLNVPTLLDDSFLPIPHSRNTSDAIYWSMNQTNLEIDSFGPVKQVTLNLLWDWEWHHIPICHVFLVIWDFLCKEYWIPIANLGADIFLKALLTCCSWNQDTSWNRGAFFWFSRYLTPIFGKLHGKGPSMVIRNELSYIKSMISYQET